MNIGNTPSVGNDMPIDQLLSTLGDEVECSASWLDATPPGSDGNDAEKYIEQRVEEGLAQAGGGLPQEAIDALADGDIDALMGALMNRGEAGGSGADDMGTGSGPSRAGNDAAGIMDDASIEQFLNGLGLSSQDMGGQDVAFDFDFDIDFSVDGSANARSTSRLTDGTVE